MLANYIKMMGNHRFIFRVTLFVVVTAVIFLAVLYKDNFIRRQSLAASRVTQTNGASTGTRRLFFGADSHGNTSERVLNLVNDLQSELQKGGLGRARLKLIILTYMRSGSSFTGDVFNNHPNVFYVYEPLTSLSRFLTTSLAHVMMMHQGSLIFHRKNPPTSPKHTLIVNHYINSFLNCDLLALDPYALSQLHMRGGVATKPFYNCAGSNAMKKDVLNVLRCLPLMYEPCRKAEVAVVKTIRYRMAQAIDLVMKDPTIKVIHLVRDPRPTLFSQMHFSAFGPKNFSQAVKDHCSRVSEDLDISQKLFAHLRDVHNKRRLLTIRYEDLALQPVRFAEKLLDFAGLHLTHKLRDYILNITSRGLPDGCPICTTRSDSRAASVKWRSRMRPSLAETVEMHCGEVFKRFGYLPLKTEEELRNLSVPSYEREFSRYPELW